MVLIDKMEGTAISSLTITPSKKKTNRKINIKNPNKVMELGFVEFSVNKKAIETALNDGEEDTAELLQYIEVTEITETTAPKLKINKKRSSNTITSTELLDDVA